MTAGIYAVGYCTNSQFACNKLFHNNYGIYFEPYSNQVATMISSQGFSGRASDNEWFDYNPIFRIGGNLNTQNYTPNWYFRNDDIWVNTFNPDLGNQTNQIYFDFFSYPNTNVNTQCSFQMTEVPEDMDFRTISGVVRDLRLDDIVFENLDYMVLENEFEYFDQEYLYEILYNNPEIMNLGEPHDTAYINFYNYLTNSNIREFIELQELIDINDINAALMATGVLVAQNVIEANIITTNEIYLSSLAQDVELDSLDRQNLFVIAMLTPYVGGEGVYSARAMLGIDPEDYNLPYRMAKPLDTLNTIEESEVKVYPNPADDILTLEFGNEIDNVQLAIYNIVGQEVVNMLTRKQITQLDIKALESGIYFFRISGSNIETVSGNIIKQ